MCREDVSDDCSRWGSRALLCKKRREEMIKFTELGRDGEGHPVWIAPWQIFALRQIPHGTRVHFDM
jgi:hypothetical protein